MPIPGAYAAEADRAGEGGYLAAFSIYSDLELQPLQLCPYALLARPSQNVSEAHGHPAEHSGG